MLKTLLYNYYCPLTTNDKYIASLINSIIPDTPYIWSDLQNLTDIVQLQTSYDRVTQLSYGYSCKKSKYYNDKSLFNIITDSLERLSKFYNKKTKKVGNWWQYYIGIPFKYGLILLLTNYMDSNYNDIIEKFVVKNTKSDLTYANQASICRNLYIAGINLNNFDYINNSIKLSVPAYEGKTKCQIKTARNLQKFCVNNPWFIKDVQLYAGKEGIYDDYSFLQHTSVPYIGTYGSEIIEFAALLCKTILMDEETLSNKQFKSSKYLQEILKDLDNWKAAYALAIYEDEVTLPYCGRSVYEMNPKSNASTITKYMYEIYGNNDWKYNYDFVFAQNNADRAIYQYNGWRFIISMCSDRIAKYESFNGQNQTGWNQNLGMTYLYTPGCTYKNYFNSISPYYLPGVTCNNKQREIKESKQVLFNYNKEDMKRLRAGSTVVETNNIFSKNMFSMFQMVDNGCEAKKSYFIIDDFIICLGTDIKGENLYTTIFNQEIKKDITISDTIYIDEYGTIIAKNQDIHKEKMNKTNVLYINNSTGKYEYAIVPLQNVNADYVYNKVKIINENNIQGIYTNDLIMLNFWKSGKITINEHEIESDNMAQVALVNNGNNNYKLIVYDITQDLSKIKITLNGKYTGTNCNIKYKNIDEQLYSEISINCKDLLGQNTQILLTKNI